MVSHKEIFWDQLGTKMYEFGLVVDQVQSQGDLEDSSQVPWGAHEYYWPVVLDLRNRDRRSQANKDGLADDADQEPSLLGIVNLIELVDIGTNHDLPNQNDDLVFVK